MSALTFDIKGFFDFVNYQYLLTEMQSRQIPLEYLKWTANFLDNCKAAICVDGTRGDSKPVKNGIPQGSLVLSILVLFYLAGLLEVFQDKAIFSTLTNLEADKPSDIGILIYVDNSKLERKTGIYLNRLNIANPVIYCLPTAWTQTENSALRQKTNFSSKGTTQLIYIAAHTVHTHKQVFLFLSPHGKRHVLTILIESQLKTN